MSRLTRVGRQSFRALRLPLAVVAVAVSVAGLAAMLLAAGQAAATTPTACSGDAFSVWASIPPGPTIVGPIEDTGPLTSCADVHNVTLASLANPLPPPDSLTASLLHNTTTGGNPTHSEASLKNLSLLLATNTVTADEVTAHAEAQCTPTGPAVSGGSVVTNLVVNGTPVIVSGGVNETHVLGPVTVVINEQTSSIGGNSGTMTVTALHVAVGGAIVFISQAHADITCTLPDTPTNTPTNTATNTPTNTPTASPATATPASGSGPIRVGGVADVHIGRGPGAGAASESSGGTGTNRAMAITLLAAVACSLAAGGWYLRRRLWR